MRPSKFKLAEKLILNYLKKNYERDNSYFGWYKKGLKTKQLNSNGQHLIPISEFSARFIPPFGLRDIDVLEKIHKLAKEKSWRELKDYLEKKRVSELN